MLLGKDLGNLNKEQYELMSKVTVQNDRLIDLVEDLLDASRIEEGRFGYTFEPTDIAYFINNILTQVMPQARRARPATLATGHIRRTPGVHDQS